MVRQLVKVNSIANQTKPACQSNVFLLILLNHKQMGWLSRRKGNSRGKGTKKQQSMLITLRVVLCIHAERSNQYRTHVIKASIWERRQIAQCANTKISADDVRFADNNFIEDTKSQQKPYCTVYWMHTPKRQVWKNASGIYKTMQGFLSCRLWSNGQKSSNQTCGHMQWC